MMGNTFIKRLHRHAKDESGASLIEYSIVIVLFLLLFFATLDFGRLGFNWVMTEKAMQRAVRIAATRPPICPGVPATNQPGLGSSFGTLCRDINGCAAPATAVQQCVLSRVPSPVPANWCDTLQADLSGSTPTAAEIYTRNALQVEQEIWCLLEPILPSNASPRSIRVAYSHAPSLGLADLGFAGGPYIPIVEVGTVSAADVTAGVANAEELRFQFITPLPGLAAVAGGSITQTGANNSIPFPDLSAALPGEDLGRGG